jgi:hypothetical protein
MTIDSSDIRDIDTFKAIHMATAAMSDAYRDPYDAGPLGHATFQGMGQGDPNMGVQQLLAMLALASAGVGGGAPMGVPAGGSGVNFDRGNPGIMSTI